MLRSIRLSLVVGCLAGLWVAGSVIEARAQGAAGQAPPAISGTITGLETKGRTTTVTFTDEGGNAFEFALNPKLDLEVSAAGDLGFLAAGAYVEIEALQSNDYYFGSQFRVFPQFAGRSQPAKAVKAPPVPGRSMNLYHINGEIVRFEDKGDEKYHKLYLKVNPKTEQLVYVETNHKITVVLTDASAVEEGQAASVVGRVLGTRLIPSKLSIDTKKSLKAEEFLPTLEKKK